MGLGLHMWWGLNHTESFLPSFPPSFFPFFLSFLIFSFLVLGMEPRASCSPACALPLSYTPSPVGTPKVSSVVHPRAVKSVEGYDGEWREPICLKISFWLLGRQERRRGFSEIRQSEALKWGQTKHSVETGFWRLVPLLPCHQRGDADQ